jgi:hypothetical protein
MSYKDVMLDLETLDTRPGAVILSLGAVFFNPIDNMLGEECHWIISRADSEALGLTVSADTLAWWEKQSAEAKKTLRVASSTDGEPLAQVLHEFNEFLGKAKGGTSKVKIWGNGSDFDNVLLIAAYEAAKVKPAWKYYNHRCFRTLKGLAPAVKIDRQGTYHNALDDAKTQAEHAIKIYQHLGLKDA